MPQTHGWHCRPPVDDLRGPDLRAAPPFGPRGARPRWLHPDEVQQYAQRTAAFAAGQVTAAEFEARPGLEPVWVRFLHDLQLVTMPGEALDQIDEVI